MEERFVVDVHELSCLLENRREDIDQEAEDDHQDAAKTDVTNVEIEDTLQEVINEK
jgi:hypothetical protein